MRMLRLSVASIVLLLLTTSALGCQYLLPPDDPAVFPTREVVVAEEAIGQGTTIEPEMLSVRVLPADDTNSTALTDPATALGQVAAVDILRSQMITPNLLVAE